MVLLPDKLPLPSLLVDVHQMAQQKMKKDADSSHSGHMDAYTGAEHILPRAPLSDAQFMRLLARQQLPGWGHEVKLRVIFLLLCRFSYLVNCSGECISVFKYRILSYIKMGHQRQEQGSHHACAA